jgi:hypothetical protein
MEISLPWAVSVAHSRLSNNSPHTGEYIASVLHDGGLLVLGVHERLPHDLEGFAPWQVGFPIYRRVRSWHVTAGKRNAANLSSSHSRRNYEFETHRLRKR